MNTDTSLPAGELTTSRLPVNGPRSMAWIDRALIQGFHQQDLGLVTLASSVQVEPMVNWERGT